MIAQSHAKFINVDCRRTESHTEFRERKNTLVAHTNYKSNYKSSQKYDSPCREDWSDYVAHLQLHMSLQARNLVPTLHQATAHTTDSRSQLLHQAQADAEKLASRQAL